MNLPCHFRLISPCWEIDLQHLIKGVTSGYFFVSTILNHLLRSHSFLSSNGVGDKLAKSGKNIS